MTINDRLIALIRTYVPYAVGAAAAWVFATFALDLRGDVEAAVVAFSIPVVQNLYYLVVRVAETRFPAVGVLLGISRVPAYTDVANLWT